MTLHALVTTLALALSLTACADAPSTSVAQGPRGTWEEAGVDSYTITVERLCFCPAVGPHVVTVVDGEVSSVTREGKDVDPDGENGYPTKIAIDRWENAIDDEVTYVVRDLQVDA